MTQHQQGIIYGAQQTRGGNGHDGQMGLFEIGPGSTCRQRYLQAYYRGITTKHKNKKKTYSNSQDYQNIRQTK